nr:unnamed protein product [Digitaria exilis]
MGEDESQSAYGWADLHSTLSTAAATLDPEQSRAEQQCRAERRDYGTARRGVEDPGQHQPSEGGTGTGKVGRPRARPAAASACACPAWRGAVGRSIAATFRRSVAALTALASPANVHAATSTHLYFPFTTACQVSPLASSRHVAPQTTAACRPIPHAGAQRDRGASVAEKSGPSDVVRGRAILQLRDHPSRPCPSLPAVISNRLRGARRNAIPSGCRAPPEFLIVGVRRRCNAPFAPPSPPRARCPPPRRARPGHRQLNYGGRTRKRRGGVGRCCFDCRDDKPPMAGADAVDVSEASGQWWSTTKDDACFDEGGGRGALPLRLAVQLRRRLRAAALIGLCRLGEAVRGVRARIPVVRPRVYQRIVSSDKVIVVAYNVPVEEFAFLHAHAA